MTRSRIVLVLATTLAAPATAQSTTPGQVTNADYDRAAKFYHRSLPKALEQPGRVLGFAALVFALSMLLVPTLGLDLIPQLAQVRLDLTVTLPPGTPLAETDRVVGTISARHAKD